jgi:VIT1/CCC1 family predicted Fe2+/Mn2+ transporter
MKHSLRVGFSFGLTSGIITTLGLIVGLHAGTHSRLAVLGGIFTIAIADAFSDALGMHISREAEQKHSTKEVWEATVATFLAKFVFALTFIIPVLLLDLGTAIFVSACWGLLVLGILSYNVAKAQGTRPHSVIGEHLFIAIMVIVITHYVGDLISIFFTGG